MAKNFKRPLQRYKRRDSQRHALGHAYSCPKACHKQSMEQNSENNPVEKQKTYFKPFRTNGQHLAPNEFASYPRQCQAVSRIGVTHLEKRILHVTKCVMGFFFKTGSATFGQHSVYVRRRSKFPWLHHTNCIKVYEANRCLFRLLRIILGKIPALKA